MYVTLYRLVKQVGRILCTIRLYGDGDVRGGSPVRQSLSESSSSEILARSYERAARTIQAGNSASDRASATGRNDRSHARVPLCILHTVLHPSYTLVLSRSGAQITSSVFLFLAEPFLFFDLLSSLCLLSLSVSFPLYASVSICLLLLLFLFFMLSCPYFPSFFLTLILSQHRFASPLETRLSNLFPARMRSRIVAEIPNSLPADDFHSQRERRRDATPRTPRRFFARIVHPDLPPRPPRITVHRINPIFFFVTNSGNGGAKAPWDNWGEILDSVRAPILVIDTSLLEIL